MKIIAGTHKGRDIRAAKGTRPTLAIVRKCVFDILQDMIEGATVLDLFAGSGALGIEALSRGASSVVFVDREKKALSCIKENLISLKISPNDTQLLHAQANNALQYFARKKVQFNVIFIDPPYAEIESSEQLFTFIDTTLLLAPRGHLFIEAPARSCLPILQGMYLQFASVRKIGSTQLQEYIY